MRAAATSKARHADIMVVGAGVLGTFHAYFAAKKGYKVLLLERNAFPTDASIRNFGMGVQTIVEAKSEWAEYARASREIYRTLQGELDLGVRVTGSLYLASTELERQVLTQFAERFASLFHCSYLEAGEALARYPFVQASYCAGALCFSNDLSLEPRRMLRQ